MSIPNSCDAAFFSRSVVWLIARCISSDLIAERVDGDSLPERIDGCLDDARILSWP